MKKDKKWYLIDFGIASNFKDETKIDPSKAGNGTLWFMSRDAHRGQMSRKCDLESVVFILALLDGETLDWQVKLNKTEENKKLILEKKNEFFENLDKRLLIPRQHKNFMKSVDRFIPGTNPDYKNFQSMFY
jgi:serine/threonine protein kinase